MQPRQFTLLAIALTMSPLTHRASAQAADPMVGTWKLSLSKSTFGPKPTPKSGTIQVEQNGDMLHVRVAWTDNDGTTSHYVYSVKKDGKEYPVTVNGVPDSGTTIFKRIDERTTEIIALRAGKELDSTHVVVSRDGRTQTATGSATDSKGQKYSVVTVYEKQ